MSDIMGLMPLEDTIFFLRRWSNALGVGVSEIARRSDMSKSTVSRILKGQGKNPSYDNIRKIWNALEEIQKERLREFLSLDRMLNRNIYTVSPDHPLKEVLSVMVSRDYSVVPVVDSGGNIVGKISRKFLTKYVGKDIQFISVGEIMEKAKPSKVKSTTPLKEIISKVMEGELVVVEEKGKIVGIITWWDILKALKDSL